MSESSFVSKLYRRLRKKVLGIIPIIIGAAVLVGGLSLLIYLVAPSFPEPYQRILQELQRGDWAAGRTTLTHLIDSYGTAQGYVFVMVQVLQVLFAPIPGQLLGLLGGYLFGFWFGLLLTMVGLALGSWVAMGLGRLFGTYIARKLIPRSVLSRFDYLIDEGGLWNFFVLFLLPTLPDDAICLMAGFTRLHLWKLLLVCVVGRLPGMAVLTFVGANAGANVLITTAVLTIAVIAACILWLFSEEVERYFYRLSKR